jgi:predicted cupin superfamily sugar epimerase
MTSEALASGGAHRPEQPTAADIIAALDLIPHREGGYFRETYRAAATVTTLNGERPTSTAILYLLTDSEASRFHRLRSDEVWFYHSGALAELVLLGPADDPTKRRERRSASLPERRVVGPGSPYALVPAGWWVAARAISGEQSDWGNGRAPERRWTADRRSTHDFGWTLVSCVVTPGFEYADFELGDRAALLSDYPLAKELILALT